MNTITSFAQFADSVREFKQNHDTVWTNCFMLPEEIQRLIASKKMMFVVEPDDLFFLVVENSHYHLFYYTSSLVSSENTSSLASLDGNKPIILDLVAREKILPQIDQAIENKWKPKGFLVYSIHNRLIKQKFSSDNYSSEGNAYLVNGNEYFLITHDSSKVDAIARLWAQCLDPYSISLPIREELQSLMERGNVYSLCNINRELCAAMLMVKQGYRAIIQHVCVHTEYRRIGLANILLKATMQNAANSEVNTYQIWVDEKNYPANQLYRGHGFEPDGMISKQLILRN